MMTDFHCHILPGIDDGSADVEMTMQMLREEQRQGVRLIAATPHFYAHRTNVDQFLREREKALERTRNACAEQGEELPELLCGAEVYYFPGIGRAGEIARLCVGGTRTLLLEMPFAQWDEGVLADVRALREKQGLRVVLAHIERYLEFQKKKEIWDQVMALPVMKQMNAGSFLPEAGWRGMLHRNKKRAFCMRFLAEHEDALIGTDCHNMTSRRPNLARAREEILRELGQEPLDRADRAVARALERAE